MNWRLARSLETLRAAVYQRWPGTTVGAIGDTRHCPGTSDHCPNAAGVVRAIDVMSPVAADILWEELLRLRDPRMKYMIHDSKIVNRTVSPWQVRDYSGSNPHASHIHISVSNRVALYDDPAAWLTRPKEDIMATLDAEDLAAIAEAVTRSVWTHPVGRSGDTHSYTLSRARADAAAARALVEGLASDASIDQSTLAQKIAERVNVDVEALAATLGHPANATEVADELARRLAG